MFETSRKSDEILHEAHAAMAYFLNASRPEEIIFGNNMTTLTLHMSRTLAVNPVRKLTKMAKDAGALVYIDTVQYAPHGPIDVQDIGCDFLVCSSYKYYRTQITRHLQFYGSPGHRKDTKVTFWNRIPEWVMGYNQRLSPISFSEFIQ